ncbi:MAG TPA: tetratricopeptide repeat protein [Terriglobia bacterium]|nr:tetratricopeptide repeat protein [Terriglobia bacterium]
MRCIGKYVGLAILAAVAFGVGTARAQNGGLTGHVTLQDGSACVKCPIIIERQSVKGHYETKTDKKGNYVYIGLTPDQYKITLEDQNGKVLYYIGHHVDIGDPTVVDFNLPKEMAEQQKANQSNPVVQQQQAEQQKQTQQFNNLKQMFDQGVALENQKQYADAAAMFQKAEPMAKGKNLEAVMEHEASNLENAKMYDQAIAEYQKLIADDPTNASFHSNLGTAYASQGKAAEAESECAKAAQIAPADGTRCYFNLGAIANNAGKMDDAASAFKKATELDPKNADAFFLEGQALMGKATMGADNKIVPAPGTVEALQTYLQLDPSGKYAATAQGMLQSIQGAVQTEYKATKKKKSS